MTAYSYWLGKRLLKAQEEIVAISETVCMEFAEEPKSEVFFKEFFAHELKGRNKAQKDTESARLSQCALKDCEGTFAKFITDKLDQSSNNDVAVFSLASNLEDLQRKTKSGAFSINIMEAGLKAQEGDYSTTIKIQPPEGGAHIITEDRIYPRQTLSELLDKTKSQDAVILTHDQGTGNAVKARFASKQFDANHFSNLVHSDKATTAITNVVNKVVPDHFATKGLCSDYDLRHVMYDAIFAENDFSEVLNYYVGIRGQEETNRQALDILTARVLALAAGAVNQWTKVKDIPACCVVNNFVVMACGNHKCDWEAMKEVIGPRGGTCSDLCAVGLDKFVANGESHEK